MLKLRIHKAAFKRCKMNKNGKILCKHAGKNHLLLKKSKNQKQRLSKSFFIHKKNYLKMKLILTC